MEEARIRSRVATGVDVDKPAVLKARIDAPLKIVFVGIDRAKDCLRWMESSLFSLFCLPIALVVAF
jgi:hypothetical protein